MKILILLSVSLLLSFMASSGFASSEEVAKKRGWTHCRCEYDDERREWQLHYLFDGRGYIESRFKCGACDRWVDNMRACAKRVNALRKSGKCDGFVYW